MLEDIKWAAVVLPLQTDIPCGARLLVAVQLCRFLHTQKLACFAAHCSDCTASHTCICDPPSAAYDAGCKMLLSECLWCLCWLQGLTDAGLAHLSFAPLTQLSLVSCPGVTAGGLRRLVLTCPSLQAVQLVSCTAVSPDEAERLQYEVRSMTGRRVEVKWRSSKHGPRHCS